MKTNPHPKTMNNKKEFSGKSSDQWRLSKRTMIWPVATLVALATGLALWSTAQSVSPPPQAVVAPEKQRLGEPDEPPAQRQKRELSRLAILEPAAFGREVAKNKTSQEVQEEQIAVFAITQPKFYSTEFEKFKNAERRQLEQQARAVILDPLKFYGPAKKKEKQSPAPPQSQSGRP